MKKLILGIFVFGLIFFIGNFAKASSGIAPAPIDEEIIPPVEEGWVDVGNPAFSQGYVQYTSMTIDSNNIPYVIYRDSLVDGKATVVKFNGTNWVYVGIQGFSAGEVYWPQMVLDSNNIPHVVYVEKINNEYKVTTKKLENNIWIDLGSSFLTSMGPHVTSVAIDSDNIPYISYVSDFTTKKANVMKFENNAWGYVGAPNFSQGPANGLSLVIDEDNFPYLGYSSSLNSYKQVVVKFNGTNWVYVGDPSGFSAGTAVDGKLAFSPTGPLYVVYKANGLKATVMKFNGTNWVYVGDPSGFSAGVVYYPTIAIDSDGVPYVGFRDQTYDWKAVVMKFNGTTWANVGNPGISQGLADTVSIAIDSNDMPYIAYKDGANSNYATVKKYVFPTITVTTPNGGENFTAGQQFTVTWTSTGIQENEELYIELVEQGTTNSYYSLTGSTINDWSEVFTIPLDIQPGQYKIHIRKTDGTVEDYSDNSFTIQTNTSPSIDIFSPGSGSSFQPGGSLSATWTTSGITSTANLQFSLAKYYSNEYFVLVDATPNDQMETFTIPTSIPEGYYTLCAKYLGSNGEILAEGYTYSFVVQYGTPVSPIFTITSPNNGGLLSPGEQVTVNWTSTGVFLNDKLGFALVRDGDNLQYELVNQTLNDGSEVLTIPQGVLPGQYKIFGSFLELNLMDYTDNSFAVN